MTTFFYLSQIIAQFMVCLCIFFIQFRAIMECYRFIGFICFFDVTFTVPNLVIKQVRLNTSNLLFSYQGPIFPYLDKGKFKKFDVGQPAFLILSRLIGTSPFLNKRIWRRHRCRNVNIYYVNSDLRPATVCQSFYLKGLLFFVFGNCTLFK